MDKCPETGDECYQRFSCEHSAKGNAIICMKANVRRWINEEPPFGTNKPEKKINRRLDVSNAGRKP